MAKALSREDRLARHNVWRWWKYPDKFVKEQFGVEPDEWQKDFLYNFVGHQRSGAKACKGPGKTCALAWCVWLFMACKPFTKGAATSVTADNLRDGLWSELSKWQKKSEFLTKTFVWTKTRIYHEQHPEDYFMSARQWSKSASPEAQADTLAGLHADNILFVIDEAGSVPDAVAAAAEAALANEGSEVSEYGTARFLICGNPNVLSGPLYRACSSEAHEWKMIEITGDPDDPKRSPRISKDWARKQIRTYGADNPWVMINVFGKFPPMSVNSILGPDDLESAMTNTIPLDAYQSSPKILGVDVARQGDDSTVIYPRQGLVAFKPKVLRIPNTLQIAAHVAKAADAFNADAIFVDATGGWGCGVIERLQELHYNVIGVQFAGKALDAQYFNKRAEIIYECANWIRDAGACLPRDDKLKGEGVAITYFYNKDKLQIVEKDQIKELIGRSPDHFDALALTFSFPVARKNPLDRFKQSENMGDYNPIEHDIHRQDPVDDYDPLH